MSLPADTWVWDWVVLREMLPYCENKVSIILEKDKWGQPVLQLTAKSKKMKLK
jgi:hypothetical protein